MTIYQPSTSQQFSLSAGMDRLPLHTTPNPPQAMMNLEVYFAHLMLRELEQFRVSAPTPAEDDATEVAQPNPPPSFATGQHSTAVQTAVTNSAIDDDEENKQQALASKPRDITALVDADEAANGFQGTQVRLITLRNATDRQRKTNGARQQRIYRLAQKIGVTPGAGRWVRNGRPYMQPAVPRSVVRADGTVEYNQFMYDGVTGQVVLRMPGGWKRDLVRTRPQFLGVAVVDGFLWPRFDRSLLRRMTVDWEEQGFVEFNEVRYTTRFIPREPKSASSVGSDEEDGILIKFDE